VIPLIIAGAWLLWSKVRGPKAKDQSAKSKDTASQKSRSKALLEFYTPFAFLFIICNLAKFAPWEWDNIKLLIYWFVGSLPLIAYFIAWAWEKKAVLKLVAAVCFVTLIFAGALDVWRTASGQINIQVFENDAIQIANEIKTKTDPHAVFLNNPTFNTPVILSGRLSLMRYTGHLSSHGIDYGERDKDLRTIYAGSAVADVLLRKYNIDYVLVGPEERSKLQANDSFFSRYPVIADTGQYRVYKVK
jgi:hypothetical protein